MDERTSLRRERSGLPVAPEVDATLRISLVWLVFYVVLLGHGLMAQKTATTAAVSADQASVQLSADRKEPAPAARGQ